MTTTLRRRFTRRERRGGKSRGARSFKAFRSWEYARLDRLLREMFGPCLSYEVFYGTSPLADAIFDRLAEKSRREAITTGSTSVIVDVDEVGKSIMIEDVNPFNTSFYIPDEDVEP